MGVIILTVCVLLAVLQVRSLRPPPVSSTPSPPVSLEDVSELRMDYPGFNFEVLSSLESGARTGRLSTPHGEVLTPAFVFCATKAAMKSISPQHLRSENTQFILSNTYHLMLSPGAELVEQMGGLQTWSGWRGPMLTDSGGYQIFSMGHGSVSEEIKGSRNLTSLGRSQSLLRINEEGALFRSYVDGSLHSLTPELCMDIQRQLGADIVLVLDECTPFHVDRNYTAESTRRSHRWAIRCLDHFNATRPHNTPSHNDANDENHDSAFSEGSDGTRRRRRQQALYGIVQGGVYPDLRKESVDFVNHMPFFGSAIGGSLGGTRRTMHEVVSLTRGLLRPDRPVHLLGIGAVRDIFQGVRCGIDSFDCVHPTRIARHGGVLVKAAHWDAVERKAELESRIEEQENKGKLDWRNRRMKNMEGRRTVREHYHVSKGQYRLDTRPLEENCTCSTCTIFTRSYVHHLFRVKELLGGTLVSIHNIHFMNQLMADIRYSISLEIERLDNSSAILL